jgi:hypothetical protein
MSQPGNKDEIFSSLQPDLCYGQGRCFSAEYVLKLCVQIQDEEQVEHLREEY